jgi:hypothetical protein
MFLLILPTKCLGIQTEMFSRNMVPLLFYSCNLSSTEYTVYDENTFFSLENLLGSFYQKHCCVDSFCGVYDFTLKASIQTFFMLFCTL